MAETFIGKYSPKRASTTTPDADKAGKSYIDDEWNFQDQITLEELGWELGTKPVAAFTSDLAIKVCIAVSTDPRPLKKIIEDDDTMPSVRQIEAWRLSNPVFARNFNAAKKAQSQILIEEIIDIIDDPANCEPEILSWSKAKVNTRQWLASKLLPKIYGDQKQIDELKSQNEQRDAEIRALRTELDAKNKKEY